MPRSAGGDHRSRSRSRLDLDQRQRPTSPSRSILGPVPARLHVGHRQCRRGALSIVASRSSRAVPTMRASGSECAANRRRCPDVSGRRVPQVHDRPSSRALAPDGLPAPRAAARERSLSVIADRKSAPACRPLGAGAARRCRAGLQFHSNSGRMSLAPRRAGPGRLQGTDRYPAYFHGQNLDVLRPAGTCPRIQGQRGDVAAELRTRTTPPRCPCASPCRADAAISRRSACSTCADSEWCGSVSR